MSIRILGTGSALPAKVVSNVEIEQIVETSDEWITERTGIKERRISTGETVASLSTEACRNALEMAGKRAEEIDLIIIGTCSAEMALPSVACQVQSAIGATNAVAFDINIACAGFLFSLHTAYAYLQTGIYKNALIVGAEVLSKIIDWSDRSTCVLFGDGAGAVYLEEKQETVENRKLGIQGFVQKTDGTKGMALSCLARPVKNAYFQDTNEIGYVQMNGQEVYKFATRKVPECILEVLNQVEITKEEIDYFILHQANIRIIEAVAKRLEVDMVRFPINLERVANMSAATIPVLLDELNRASKLKVGDRLVMSGFGAGLAYGACVIVWG